MVDVDLELDKLHAEYASDTKLRHLLDDGIFFVPGDGPMQPKLMLIGEAPGRLENARRQPFVGKAGMILADILTKIGLNVYADVYMTNVIKYWPVDITAQERKTRTPTTQELQAAAPYIRKEIELVRPLIVGLCGYSAITALYPKITSIYEYNGMLLDNRFVPLYHPATLSYKPQEREKVERGYATLPLYIEEAKKHENSTNQA